MRQIREPTVCMLQLTRCLLCHRHTVPVCLCEGARAVPGVSRVAGGDSEAPPTRERRHRQLGQLLPSTLEVGLLGGGQGASASRTLTKPSSVSLVECRCASDYGSAEVRINKYKMVNAVFFVFSC